MERVWIQLKRSCISLFVVVCVCVRMCMLKGVAGASARMFYVPLRLFEGGPKNKKHYTIII